MPSAKRAYAAIFAATTVCGCSAGVDSSRPGGTILDLVLPKTACVIRLQNSTDFYKGADGQIIALTDPQCVRANGEAQRAESEAQANAQAQRAVPSPIVAHSPAPHPPKYEPRYSEKIEADNGAVYRVDLNGTRYFANGVETGVYDEGSGGDPDVLRLRRSHGGVRGADVIPSAAFRWCTDRGGRLRRGGAKRPAMTI
jgi:hypothetical protein